MGLPFYQEQDQQLVHYTVEAILEGLKTSDSTVLEYIYKKYFQIVRFFVIKNSGTDEDAKDVFQEAIILIYKRLKDGSLDLTCAFKTYLYSVCRILWLRQLEKRKVRNEVVTDNQVFVQLDEDIEGQFAEQEQFRIYQKHFQLLHKDCQEILQLFLKRVPLKEIAQKMNIKSDKYLKKRKYACKEALIKRIQNDPEYKRLRNEN
ncbi:MAG: sigma-70 family RNA polymerase sigma factor [Porphyromonadaceae bacterium]|nr:MAG: sigma-70 family RNA polymerase sigma factor [Porphyromonadaceae bacterium]